MNLFSGINAESSNHKLSSETQQRNTMITKNGVMRPHKNSSLIISPKNKIKPSKIDAIESEIDLNNLPTIQGTYTATKLITPKPESAQNTTTSPVTTAEPTTPKTVSTKLTTTTEKTLPINFKGQVEIVLETTTKVSTLSPVQTGTEYFNPYFENSPWKPIVPPFVNTQVKFVTENDTVTVGTVPIESTTEKIPMNSTKVETRIEDIIIPSSIVDIEVPSIITQGASSFDNEQTDFPHDRVVPQETGHYRINSKFKNILAEPEEVSSTTSKGDLLKEKIITKLDENLKGTFEVHLKTASEGNIVFNKTEHEKNETSMGMLHNGMKLPADILGSTTDPMLLDTNTPMLLPVEELPMEPYTGVGVAEPVSDIELTQELRNSFSQDGNDQVKVISLQNKKSHVLEKQPIYTSYKTPHLSGGDKVGIIENPGLIKPFRHTIPVDKISPALEGEIKLDSEGSNGTLSDIPESKNVVSALEVKVTNSTEMLATDSSVVRGMPEIFGAYFKNENESKVLDNLERIVKITTFVKDNENVFRVNFPTKNVKIELLEHDQQPEKVEEKGNLTDSSRNSSTNSDQVGTKIDKQEEKSNDNSPKLYSRNSTFIEVDTVKHIPGQVTHHTHSNDKQTDILTVKSQSELETHQDKKNRNVSAKATGILNVVTLAPVKSNSGVGRPIRPRPKNQSNSGVGKASVQKVSLINNQSISLTESLKVESSSNRSIPTTHIYKAKKKNDTSEQIIEVVTSISTKVSTSVKSSELPVKISKLSNTTDTKNQNTVPTDNSVLVIASFPENKTKVSVKTDENETNNTTVVDESKSANISEDLKKLDSAISTGEISVNLRDDKNIISSDMNNLTVGNLTFVNVSSTSKSMKSVETIAANNKPSSLEDIIKMAEVAEQNLAMKNVSKNFKLNRDGLKIPVKVMNKPDATINSEAVDETVFNGKIL